MRYYLSRTKYTPLLTEALSDVSHRRTIRTCRKFCCSALYPSFPQFTGATDTYSCAMSVCLELPLASPGSGSTLGKRKRGVLRGGNSDGIQMINGKMVRITPALPSTSTPSVPKRKSRSVSPDEWRDEEGSEDEEQQGPLASGSASPSKRVEKAPRKPPNRKSRYACMWEGCSKTYTRPVRLAEHMRSHTGERPFVCTYPDCTASYLRETHLAAHIRTHKNDEDKPLGCEEEGCDKRFWTNQHLKRHIKLVHENGKGSYPVRSIFLWPVKAALLISPVSVRAMRESVQQAPSTSIAYCGSSHARRYKAVRMRA